jgi:hypothetical protein
LPVTVLSLHQPLASLMVWGLKRVEGRGAGDDLLFALTY